MWFSTLDYFYRKTFSIVCRNVSNFECIAMPFPFLHFAPMNLTLIFCSSLTLRCSAMLFCGDVRKKCWHLRLFFLLCISHSKLLEKLWSHNVYHSNLIWKHFSVILHAKSIQLTWKKKPTKSLPRKSRRWIERPNEKHKHRTNKLTNV